MVVEKQLHMMPNKVRFNGVMLDSGLKDTSRAAKSNGTGAPLVL